MKAIIDKALFDYVLDDLVWKVDLPALLNEIATASPHAPYTKCFSILAYSLKALAVRAIELEDPALNIIMLNLGLYDNSHAENIESIKQELRKEITINP